MNKDLISVIVPVYNCEKYVRQTLDSIVNQTYKNLEILVIDDGSTDNSPSICDEYAVDERVKVFHRQNVCVAASRQFGIDNCKGTYFVTLDSDDYIAEDYVEKLYKAIKMNDADISVCGVSCFLDGKNEMRVVYLPDCQEDKIVTTKESLSNDFYKISLEMLLTDSWNKMHRTQFVRDSGVRYILEKKYTGPELQFEHRLALHCPVYCVCRESLLFHRNRKGSRVQRKNKPLQEGFEIITESIIEELNKLQYTKDIWQRICFRKQMSQIYYGLIGRVIQDIYLFGGGIIERHRRFEMLVLRKKRFLRKHQDDIDAISGRQTFKISRYSIPAFVLDNALWLDTLVLMKKIVSMY